MENSGRTEAFVLDLHLLHVFAGEEIRAEAGVLGRLWPP